MTDRFRTLFVVKFMRYGTGTSAEALTCTSNGIEVMVNIWLDDERDPNDPTIQELFGAELGMIWVKTTHAAISWLKSKTVSWISLDHDLGTTTTGYDVAKWIEERAYSGELPRLAWTVHSANVAGARAIRVALQNADRFWSRHEQNTAPISD